MYYFKLVLEAISTSCADGLWRGGGWGKHISLAAIFEGKHISLVICVRGNTYHGGTHITVTPVQVTAVLRILNQGRQPIFVAKVYERGTFSVKSGI